MAHRYAALADMTARYGAAETTRLSVADGVIPDAPVAARIESAIEVATDTIDSYLRGRYVVPLAPVPLSIVEAACILARHALASGGDREPSEQMRLSRDATIAWLKSLGDGRASLEGVAPVSSAAGARSSDRERVFSHATTRDW